MICPRCQALSPEGSKYCFQCGAALGPSDEFDYSAESEREDLRAGEDLWGDLPEMHWFLVLVYNVISLGIYAPVWFLRRLGTFHRLKSERLLNAGLLTASLTFTLASLVCSLVLVVWQDRTLSIAGLPVSELLDNFSTFLDFSAWLLLAQQSLVLRRMLKDHAEAQDGYAPITALWTILFQNMNLQHAINGLKRRRRL